jgi:ribonuclease HII
MERETATATATASAKKKTPKKKATRKKKKLKRPKKPKKPPNPALWDFDQSQEGRYVLGVDEAGMGALCGPVVVGGVVIDTHRRPDPDTLLFRVNDSKKCSSESKRTQMHDAIVSNAQCDHGAVVVDWTVEMSSAEVIDRIGIAQATKSAMDRVIQTLSSKADTVLVDGTRRPSLDSAITIIKGDSKSAAIASASILAKVHRDTIMNDLAKTFPNYQWEKNKGYPAPSHLKALREFGVTPFHRTSYAPCRRCIEQSVR